MTRLHPPRPIIAAFVSGALLAGCAATSEELQVLREEPGFAAGFGDGCTTGQEEEKSFSTKRVRDAYAFENDRAYRAGWRQGYIECKRPAPEMETGGRVLGNEERF